SLPDYTEMSEGMRIVTLEEVKKNDQENREMADSFTISIREKGADPVIGYAQFILNNPRDNNPWLGLIMFHQEKQKLGYAREFLHALLDWYEANGYDSLHLGVLEKNAQVVPFYEKLGFRQYETRESEKLGKVFCLAYDLSKPEGIYE
ncbi:sortase, partial [Bradyrhizobium japonicum]